MAVPATPAEMRAYIVERLVGDTGEPDRVLDAARALAERSIPAALSALNLELASPVNLEVRNVELTRFAAARPEGATNHAMTIAASGTSPDAMTMLADSDAIAVVLSAMFGGDPGMKVAPITRDLSPTEIKIATMIFARIAEAVNGSGERAFNLRFPLAPPMTGAEMAKHVVRDGPAVRVDFAVFSGVSTGRISLLMPQRVFLKHRGDTVAGAGERTGPDWGARLGEELMRSSVRLDAMMPLSKLTLGQISGLRPGSVIAIDETAQANAVLSARKKPLFICEFGKLGDNYTVRVRHSFDAAQDLMDGLLPV